MFSDACLFLSYLKIVPIIKKSNPIMVGMATPKGIVSLIAKLAIKNIKKKVKYILPSLRL